MSCHALDGGREVLGRYVQSFGIIAHVAFSTTNTRSKQSHQLLYNVGRAVGMCICGITLSMGFEDVVHHGQTETAHQFAVELQVTVAHAVTQSVEVTKQVSGLLIRQLDDGVLVQRDAAADAVVV